MQHFSPEAWPYPDSGSDTYECFTDQPKDLIRSGPRPVLEISRYHFNQRANQVHGIDRSYRPPLLRCGPSPHEGPHVKVCTTSWILRQPVGSHTSGSGITPNQHDRFRPEGARLPALRLCRKRYKLFGFSCCAKYHRIQMVGARKATVQQGVLQHYVFHN